MRSPLADPPLARWFLTGVTVAFLALFLVMPLAAVFVEALRRGVGAYLAGISESETLAAVRLTLTVAAIAVPLNLAFGIAASWAIAKFEFRGKSVLITLIDLPFSVSPVISGLVYVLSCSGCRAGWGRRCGRRTPRSSSRRPGSCSRPFSSTA